MPTVCEDNVPRVVTDGVWASSAILGGLREPEIDVINHKVS